MARPVEQADTANVSSTISYDGSGPATLSVSAVGTGAAAAIETTAGDDCRVHAVKDPMGTISRTFYTGDQVARTVVNRTNSGTNFRHDRADDGLGSLHRGGTQDGTFNLATTYVCGAKRQQAAGPPGAGRAPPKGSDGTVKPPSLS